jgi:hypothetical protein
MPSISAAAELNGLPRLHPKNYSARSLSETIRARATDPERLNAYETDE